MAAIRKAVQVKAPEGMTITKSDCNKVLYALHKKGCTIRGLTDYDDQTSTPTWIAGDPELIEAELHPEAIAK